MRIAVNTEWTINGTAPPMRKLGLISRWDDQLSQSVELPGFQPLEYMTAGRYLGELGRIMLADYMTSVAKLGEKDTFPSKVLNKFDPHNTTFLSHYRPGGEHSLLSMLNRQFPVETADDPAFRWTEDIAEALYHIARAIEVRAAGIIAAATVGLLRCAGELPLPPGQARPEHGRLEPRRRLHGRLHHQLPGLPLRLPAVPRRHRRAGARRRCASARRPPALPRRRHQGRWHPRPRRAEQQTARELMALYGVDGYGLFNIIMEKDDDKM